MQPPPASDEIKLLKKVFLAEIIISILLFATSGALEDIGEGQILFILPLGVAYIFILAAVYTLPVLSFISFSKKQLKNFWDFGIVALAGVGNLIAAIFLTFQIVKIVTAVPIPESLYHNRTLESVLGFLFP